MKNLNAYFNFINIGNLNMCSDFCCNFRFCAWLRFVCARLQDVGGRSAWNMCKIFRAEIPASFFLRFLVFLRWFQGKVQKMLFG